MNTALVIGGLGLAFVAIAPAIKSRKSARDAAREYFAAARQRAIEYRLAARARAADSSGE
ncbi:MAG: hypothetical protein ACRECQ_03345 [Burkholderiaceae bacterium]